MKEYESPKAELISFGNSRFDTANSRCDCYTERWNYVSYNLDDDPDTWTDCELETKAFVEIGNSEIYS